MKIPVSFAIFTAFTLSACAPLLQRGEPIEIWQLPQIRVAPASGDRVDWQLRVAAPQAPGMLASSRIAVVPTPGQISVYEGARWSQAVPELLRDRLVSAFRNSGRLGAVSSDDSNLHADFELGGSLDAFQSEYGSDARPQVVIRYDARLIDPASQRILATRRFAVQRAAAGTDVAQVVAAFGTAADALSAEVVAWSLQQGERHWSEVRATDP